MINLKSKTLVKIFGRNRRQLKKVKVLTEFKQFRQRYIVVEEPGIYMNFISVVNVLTANSYTLKQFYNKIMDQATDEYKPRLSPNFRKILEMYN